MKAAGQLLFDARIRKERLAELPESVRPKTPEEAYEAQHAFVRLLLNHYGGEIVGYKIACTSVLAQTLLKVDGPFHGKMMSAFCAESPARLTAGDFFMRVVEAEFAFRMARDLPARARAFEREEVADAVEGVLGGIEVVDSRFAEWTTIGGPSLAADNACHAAWVRGGLVADWRGIDLAAQAVEVTVNGKELLHGSGSAVLGHPLTALTWLANKLASQGTGLKAGQYVTTGVTTDVYLAERGDRISADFGVVGRVELEFV